MPGDDWQRFANLRAYYSFMFAHPGKKLMFMGCEFGQEREWNHDRALDWHLLEQQKHAGIHSLIRDLNRLYSSLPALHRTRLRSGRLRMDRDRRRRRQRVRLDPQGQRCPRALPRRHQFFAERLSQLPRPRAVRRQMARGVSIRTPRIMAAAMSGTSAKSRHSEGLVPELNLTIPPLAAIFLVPES